MALSQDEKQDIINSVLSSIRTNSRTIEQLTPVSSLGSTDYFEINGGKRVSYPVLRELILPLSLTEQNALNTLISRTETALDTANEAKRDAQIAISSGTSSYIFGGTNITAGAYLNSDGEEIKSTKAFYTSDYIPVNEDDSIEWNGGSDGTFPGCLVMYDSNYSPIGWWGIYTHSRAVVLAKEGVAYIRVSFHSDRLLDGCVNVNGKIVWKACDRPGIISAFSHLGEDVVPVQISEGWGIGSDGNSFKIAANTLTKYKVIPGELLYIRAKASTPVLFLFQKEINTSSSGNLPNIIGLPVCSDFDSIILIPEGANYLSMSCSPARPAIVRRVELMDAPSDIASVNRSREVFFYPSADDRMVITRMSNNRIKVDFSVINIRHSGRVLWKTLGEVVSETGLDGTDLILSLNRSLVFDTSTDKFSIKSFDDSLSYSETVLFGCKQNSMVSFIHPSLTYYIKTEPVLQIEESMLARRNFLIYPFDAVNKYRMDCYFYGGNFFIKVGGFNLKINGTHHEKSFASIMEDLGQEGEYMKISYSHALYFNPLTLTFSIQIFNQSHDFDDIVIIANLGANDSLAYIHPSLADLYRKFMSHKEGLEREQRRMLLFEPEFYAYKTGRLNYGSGLGKSWYTRFRIFHVSDVHQYNDLLGEAVRSAQIKANVIINTGDDSTGSSDATREFNLAKFALSIEAVENNNSSNTPYVYTKGNHDMANVHRVDFRDTYGVLMEKYSSVTWGDLTGLYGYIDIPTTSMGTFRIIMLDPCDYGDDEYYNPREFQSVVFSSKQIAWLITTLRDSAQKGYHVITAMHYSFGDSYRAFNTDDYAYPDATFYQDAFMIPDIIDAMQHNNTLKRSYPDSENQHNISINEDFTNIPALKYVCHLYGHIHSKGVFWCKKSDGSKNYNIRMIGESSLQQTGTALQKVYRESGTINEIEFSALEIDTVEKAIYRVAYGAYIKCDGTPSERTTKIYYDLSAEQAGNAVNPEYATPSEVKALVQSIFKS